jgi:aspartyl-tRNA synthetase
MTSGSLRYTQIVIHDDAMLDNVNRETVIQIEGTVVERDKETVNPKLDTGLIEVKADTLEILGPCRNMLPFEIADSVSTREEVRLKYRFLDLRNPTIHNNIVLRSKVISYLRSQMEAWLMEIQTPISPAPRLRSRTIWFPAEHKGKFYALPQAPSSLMQLLMVSGFDKYFQLAPCFRDRMPRQDRSPVNLSA